MRNSAGEIDMVNLIRASILIRRVVMATTCVLGLIIGGLAILGCSPEKGISMTGTVTNSVAHIAAPPIDPLAPSRTETATFAMG